MHKCVSVNKLTVGTIHEGLIHKQNLGLISSSVISEWFSCICLINYWYGGFRQWYILLLLYNSLHCFPLEKPGEGGYISNARHRNIRQCFKEWRQWNFNDNFYCSICVHTISATNGVYQHFNYILMTLFQNW